MSEKKVFNLVHAEARRRALQYVADAPEGFSVTVKPPARNLDQNSLLWVYLTAFSEQLLWPVNGAMVTLEPEEWKDVLTAAFRNETQRIAMGLNGGMVILGLRTSKMSRRQFAEFVTFIQSVAADRGVVLGEEVAA